MKKPQFISVLHRKLKTHCTYEDFRQAWLPDPLNEKDPTKEAVEYFKGPVQVINAINASDPTDIISIGLIWGTLEEIEEDINRTKDSEEKRRLRIANVADKSQDTKFYVIKDVNLLGTSLPVLVDES